MYTVTLTLKESPALLRLGAETMDEVVEMLKAFEDEGISEARIERM